MTRPSFWLVLRAPLLGGLLALSARAETSLVPPRALERPRVDLPEAATVGTSHLDVPVHLVVEADGSVSQVDLPESRGEVLDSAVRRAALRLKFVPASKDGTPLRSRIAFLIPIDPRDAAAKTERTTSEAPRPLPAPRAAAKPGATERKDDAQELEIVVTGARAPERRGESIIDTQVISRRDLRLTGATTLGEALDAQPGLQLERTFRGTELWIRGLDPEYSLILVDGQRVPGRIGGAIDLSRYSLESIERVEIVRGPSSALYGSDAIGGVVNIITRESEAELSADAEARLGTNDAIAGSARVSGRPAENLGVSLNASHQSTAAFRADPEAVATIGSARRLSTAGGSFSLGGSRDERLRLNLDYTQTRLDGVDEAVGGAVFDRTQLQEQAMAALLYTLNRDALHLQSSAQYSQFRDQYLSDQRGATALDSYQESREHLGQASTTVAYRWDRRHRTTAGGELLAQVLDSDRLASYGYRARYSAFAQHQWTILHEGERPVLSIVPGARLDVDSQFGNQLSPKLALRWDPLEKLTFRAGYGRGFRAPSFQELLLRFENPAVGYVVTGNPDLSAESSHSFDVSAELRPDRHWLVTLAGFRNQLTDMIATVTVADPGLTTILFSYDNIDSAWTQGLESSVLWSPSELLALTSGYTLTETRNEALNRPLEGRPLHRFFLRAVSTHSPSGFTLSARGSLSVDRYYFLDQDGDGTAEQLTGDPLVQVDVRLARRFTESFELFAGVNNLADAGDAYAALLPRQFYAGLRGNY